MEPNTRLWARRTYMTASWGNEKLTVWMWPSYEVWGVFNDTLNFFAVYNMSYFGYYRGDTGLQFVSGRADVTCVHLPVSNLQVTLFTDAYAPWLWLGWLGAEYDSLPIARHLARRVTVWGPIPWQPSGS